ncbi:peroxiredoxin-6-like [Physella acuta]|uniref:peroxiredoxin-6-like n=1 Tax=Physella acuta TaxID=109671 RepID=UPI0027DAE5D7|nr:peroxiredoxin-6-like [Physella acuta]
MVKLGDVFPNFSADTSEGKIEKFHDWIGSSWAILFSHPADYTPVCTTELARVVNLEPEFKRRDVKLIALSCDDVTSHIGWGKDVLEYAGCSASKLPYPIIADEKRELAVELGMIDPDEKTKEGLPLTARAVFIIGPDKKLKLSILYPATTGRNFNEILRVIDSLQLTATRKVATPVDWQNGDKCMVIPSVSKEEAEQLFPDHEVRTLPSGKEYLRLTTQPK